MVDQRQYPGVFLKLYLRLPLAWRISGKQFLVIATKPLQPKGEGGEVEKSNFFARKE
jgi:hypothetical protein